MASASERAREESRGAPEDPHPLPQLPWELQLQIVQRSDAVAVVRCAATHKLLRGNILGPAFRPRLGVDPGLLLGFSFRENGVHRAIDTPTGRGGGQPLVRLDDAMITKFDPVAWRDGFLVIHWRRGDSIDLRVCSSFTGDVTASLPPTSLPAHSVGNLRWPWPQSYTFVLLNAAGRSFELLVADGMMRTQVFSSDRWEWGPVRDTSFPLEHHDVPDLKFFSRPAVIGRTVYWLCSPPIFAVDGMMPIPSGGAGRLIPEILSLDVDAAETTVRKVPRYCFSEMVAGCGFDNRALLTSVRGGLCLFVLEKIGISAWTPLDSEATTWSRQFHVTRPELEARAVLDPEGFKQLRLHAYGERSGALILEVTPGVFLRLDIGEGYNLARVVKLGSQDSNARYATYLCLHEIDFVYLLQDMKSFPQGASSASEITAAA